MSDEPRDDEPRDDGRNGEQEIDEGGTPEGPPPQTWAGRARAGESDAESGAESESEPEAESERGLTEEFEGLEAELSADLDNLDTDEHEPDEGPSEADELEEPPAEIEFEDDDEEPKATGKQTVEVDTLAIADRESERDAAHAGLRARAEKSAAQRVTTTGAQAAVAGAVAAVPAGDAGEPPKRSIWWRFLAASFVIVASVSSATAIAFLLYLTDIGNDLKGDESFANAVAQSLSEVEGGAPQTILIIGSDKRGTTGDPGRSDTTMLLRVDPDKRFLALLSLPRDLPVEIPGYGTDKLNAAYSYGEQFEAKNGGGSQLTLTTVKELLGIDINHIVNVNFTGFYDAINAIGGVYVDIDRHYFNPVGGEYDDIDIQAGYTRLDGYRALDYVRYRHNDNDLVRGARQQAFVREARQQIPPRDLLPFLPGSNGDDLIKIFTKYTTSDIDDAPTIIEMLKSFVEVRSAPVRQVSLGGLTAEGGVDASNDEIEAAVDQFLGNDLDGAPEPPPAESPTDREPKGKKKGEPGTPPEPSVMDITGTAEEYARGFDNHLRDRRAGLPVFYPTAVIANSAAGISEESRAHVIEPPDGTKQPFFGYKYVLPYQEGFGLSYYGVTGVNWTDPPILNNPSEVRRIDGRDYLLFYEKDRLRLVGWTTDNGAYWVINTLTRALSEEEMLAVATSTREYEG